LLRIVNEQADQILGKPGGDDNLLDIAVPLKTGRPEPTTSSSSARRPRR
jgi:hypothetical protein